jgi:Tol biopolymer transport system component
VFPTNTPTIRQLLSTPVPDFIKGKLLVVTDRFIDTGIVVMQPDGTIIQGLTGDEFYNLAATREPFSPDRKLRAIVQADSNGTLQIWIQDETTNEQKLVTRLTHGISYDPVWSPDGTRIAFVSRETGADEIYVYDIGEQTSRQITHGGDPFIYKQRPTWSPDSTQIAFKANDGTLNFQIWVMNADGSDLHNISRSDSNDYDPIWVK